MWCGMCLKYKQKECYKRTKVPKKMTRACTKFVFSTRKVPAKVLREAIELSKMPKTQVMALMALLDSGLRLKGQNLTLGLPVEYDEIPGEGKIYLISSPKRDPYAYGVRFLDKPRKNTVTSVMIPKTIFLRERDRRLKAMWEKIDEAFIDINNPDKKKKLLLKLFKKLGKNYVEAMLRLGGISITVKGRKFEDVVTELLKSHM